MDSQTIEIIGMSSTILFGVYNILMYTLPEKHAKKLKPIGRWLKFLANTPGGLKRK